MVRVKVTARFRDSDRGRAPLLRSTSLIEFGKHPTQRIFVIHRCYREKSVLHKLAGVT